MLRSVLYRCILLIALFAAIISAPAQQSAAKSNSNPPGFLLHSKSSSSVDILSPVPEADLPTLENVILPGLIKRTKAAWYPIIPPEAKPPQFLKGEVSIQFILHSDGNVTEMALVHPSGNVDLDRAAWKSIHDTVYAPFPATVTMGEVKLRFQFLYNEKPDAESTTPPTDAASPDSTSPHF